MLSNKNPTLISSEMDHEESFAVMNTAAFRLCLRVLEEAVYGAPLDSNSKEIQDLYDFLESKQCLIFDKFTIKFAEK